MTARRAKGIVVAVVMIAGAAFVSGQAQRAPATLDDLLVEVRGLRADLSQANSASVRAQLLVARLTLQEQRISGLGRQLAEVESQVNTAAAERTKAEDEFRRFDDALAGANLPIEERRAVQAMASQAKAGVSQAQANEQRLRTQAAEIANQVVVEQGRWIEFNGRLDEIERLLPAPAGGR